MIPVVALLADTEIVSSEIGVLNSVHEWGVVVFRHDAASTCGSLRQASEDYYDVCAEAPVVWIHGQPFTNAVFTVKIGSDETLTTLHPDPGSVTQSIAAWNISSDTPAEKSICVEEVLPYSGPFYEEMDTWRQVPSLQLYQNDTHTAENFLYYECTVNSEFTDNFFYWSSRGNPVFTGTSVQEALYFTPYGVFPVSAVNEEFIPLDIPMGGETNPAFASDTFCRWAGSGFLSSETNALWNTWRPLLMEQDSYWLVFPVPSDYHNEISSINLRTEDNREVEYHRLFLGAIKLNLP